MAKGKGKTITVPKEVKSSKGKAPEGEPGNGPAIKSGDQNGAAMEKVTDNTMVADPQTGVLEKKKDLQVFCSIFGSQRLPLYIKNKRGDEIKVYAHFKENKCITANGEFIAHFEKMMKEYDEQNVPLKNRRVLSERQYLSITSPEKLYVPYKGNKLHLSRVEEGLAIAEKHGWVPNYEEVLHITHAKSKVRSGTMSAGSAG